MTIKNKVFILKGEIMSQIKRIINIEDSMGKHWDFKEILEKI